MIMPLAPDHRPLTDEEFERLQSFLDNAGGEAMNLEAVDGYFAALICGPLLVSMSEALPNVLGDQIAFDNKQQADEMLGLLMRHWNTIASELRRTLREDHVYLPVLLEDSTGVVRGNDWAAGFLRGMQGRPGSWSALLNSEEEGGCLLPMMMLAHEEDPDPEMRPPPMDNEKRKEVVASMIAGLTLAYRYFEPERRLDLRSAANEPLRRRAPKIGRNDPCPCGSGRKYKHCCAQTLH
jgi:uncharacterized protein